MIYYACKVLLLRIFQDLEIFAHSQIFQYVFLRSVLMETKCHA